MPALKHPKQLLISGVATGTPVTRYIHTDNLGSTNITSDANQNRAQWFDYAPYGSVIASTNTGTTTDARQYIGQFADNSGLSYLNARYYNGAQGQFTTEDPVANAIGNPSQVQQISQLDQQTYLSDPQQLNSYAYGRDNPITKSDPSGNCAGPGIEFAPVCVGAAYGAAEVMATNPNATPGQVLVGAIGGGIQGGIAEERYIVTAGVAFGSSVFQDFSSSSDPQPFKSSHFYGSSSYRTKYV